MKKSSLFVLCIVMVLAVVLSFAACVPENTSSEDISSTTQTSSDNLVSLEDEVSEISSEITTSSVVETSSGTSNPTASSKNPETSSTPTSSNTASKPTNPTSSKPSGSASSRPSGSTLIKPWWTTSSAVTSSAVTSSAVTSSAVTSSAVTSSAVTSSAVTSSAVTSSAVTSSAVTSSAVTSSAVTSSAVTSSEVTSSKATSSTPTTSSGKNLVVAGDQYGKRIVVYDLDKVGADGDLDKAEIWDFTRGANGIRTASVKYRENTVYGDVIVSATYGYGPIIVEYPSKKELWVGWAERGGSNPHSVELLPSGNLVLASSTDGIVRIFNSYNHIKKIDKSITYTDYALSGAHGLLYDPDNNYLWALGSFELVAYEVIDNGDGTESLKKVDGVGGDIPSPRSGHDLSADLTNSRYIYLTNVSGVARYDKQTNTFETTFPGSNVLSRGNLKSFSNNTENNFVSCYPYISTSREWDNKDIAGWCSDTMYYSVSKGNGQFDVKTFTTKKSALYKLRTFCGQYN